MRRAWIGWLLCAGCGTPGEAAPGAVDALLVYGEDDRREVFEVPEQSVQAAARAVAAIIPRSRVRFTDAGAPQVVARPLQSAEQLCSDQRFATQPAAAECSGVLVDDNLVASAGHCFAHAWDCANYWFVFGYFYEADGVLGPLELYECRRARVQENDLVATPSIRDFALIELTRAVTGRSPLAIRASPLSERERLTVISTTSGVPLKVDSGARVVDARAASGDYFTLDSDTFDGSSGAPVLDAEGALAGLVARGGDDYVFDPDASCHAVIALQGARSTDRADPDGGHAARAEAASYPQPAVAALCAPGYPSRRLCDIEPRCGDMVCSPNETSASCAQDCAGEPDMPAASDAGSEVPAPSAGAPTLEGSTDALEPAARTPAGGGSAAPLDGAPKEEERMDTAPAARGGTSSGCHAASGRRSNVVSGWGLLLACALLRRRAGACARRRHGVPIMPGVSRRDRAIVLRRVHADSCHSGWK